MSNSYKTALHSADSLSSSAQSTATLSPTELPHCRRNSTVGQHTLCIQLGRLPLLPACQLAGRWRRGSEANRRLLSVYRTEGPATVSNITRVLRPAPHRHTTNTRLVFHRTHPPRTQNVTAICLVLMSQHTVADAILVTQTNTQQCTHPISDAEKTQAAKQQHTKPEAMPHTLSRQVQKRS